MKKFYDVGDFGSGLLALSQPLSTVKYKKGSS